METTEATFSFSPEEQKSIRNSLSRIVRRRSSFMQPDDIFALRQMLRDAVAGGFSLRDRYGINLVVRNLATAAELVEQIGPDRPMLAALMTYRLVDAGTVEREAIKEKFGDDTARLVNGMCKVAQLYKRSVSTNSENFRNLLLTFADDIRVVLIMIVDRLSLMRMLNHHPDEKLVARVALESRYLYAQLAHRLGLYAIKSELEDMSLKYTDRATYDSIAQQLNASKAERDRYIDNFIRPVKKRLEENGLKFEIKGRTKSIFSIWNKIKKKGVELDQIYDLFAIRVVLDTPPEREKMECWMAYSLIVDMYTSNPARMKDWITIPKSNGYESLHTTVYGPDNRWVEVQIRSRRMDEVAERGFAAHWKYKGIKSEQSLDALMNNVREMLESSNEGGPLGLMKDVKLDVYDKEVYVFTPKGDLYRLPQGATLIDFAFAIHTKVGCTCMGGRVDGRVQKLNYKLRLGDTIEIITSSQQQPKRDWLSFVTTSKARNKIRQSLNEQANKQAEIGREIFDRRTHNRKIEIDEKLLMKLVKRRGYKSLTDFFREIGEGRLDVNAVIDAYIEAEAAEHPSIVYRPAEEFELAKPDEDTTPDDVLIIGGDSIKGVNYKFARCCNPIFGDKVVGFISSEGVIKIHRADCRNLQHLCERFPYRRIDTRWSGKVGEHYPVSLRIVGHDDIGIVTNITSIITKEQRASLRNIKVDSRDGLFQGLLVVGVSDLNVLAELIRKIKAVKGVKDVERAS